MITQIRLLNSSIEIDNIQSIVLEKNVSHIRDGIPVICDHVVITLKNDVQISNKEIDSYTFQDIDSLEGEYRNLIVEGNNLGESL